MGGYQQLVRGEPFRGKFRNSFSKPEPFTPGKPEKIEFGCPMSATPSAPAIASWCRFRARGSRWWIAIRRSFCVFPMRKSSDFQKATERVYRGGADGSGLRVQLLP